jgi:hypothetical protein
MNEDSETEGTRLTARVPASAAWLGGLGALPFLGLAGAAAFLSGSHRGLASQALEAYGAVILSFLGGVHWGLAMGSHRGQGDRTGLAPRLVVSVAPSLVGWLAVLVGGSTGLAILAVGVAAMLFVDLRATRLGQAPPWYPKLRIPLSLVVIAALLVGAMA